MTGIYRFASVRIRITSVYPDVHLLCSDYSTDEPINYYVESTLMDIELERSKPTNSAVPDAYLETLAVYRKIAENLPYYDTVLFHGSAIAVDDEAFVFAAASGTGKSTHTQLWRELLGNKAIMINDDKPLIKVQTDGTAMVYGTPWDGKHHLSTNIGVPLKTICIIKRAKENSIREISKREALPMLIQQTYRPADMDAMSKTLMLLERMNVRLYCLCCNMDISAARLSYETMKE